MADIGRNIDRIEAAADAADLTADLRILAFSQRAPLADQGAARTEIFHELFQVIPQAVASGLVNFAGKDLAGVRQQRED